MNDDKNLLKTGTTTVGVIGKDVIVLAADKRATAGNLIVDKAVDKIIPVNDYLALTTAGTVSDIQLLVKYLQAELKLKELRTGRKSTVKEAATFLAGMNYHNIRKYSTIAGVCHFLLAGVDSTGLHLYDLYFDGSMSEAKEETGFMTSGSGSVFALGVLEDSWKKDLSEKETIELATRAINAAIQRDTASGQGIDLFVIDKKGVRNAGRKVVNTYAQ